MFNPSVPNTETLKDNECFSGKEMGNAWQEIEYHFMLSGQQTEHMLKCINKVKENLQKKKQKTKHGSTCHSSCVIDVWNQEMTWCSPKIQGATKDYMHLNQISTNSKTSF